jgi:ABC-type methionine transport system ATPase subunit
MALTPLLIGESQEPFHFGKVITIEPEARRRGIAAFGASGAGKSTLFRNMLALDIANGHGVTLIDPHGQLA